MNQLPEKRKRGRDTYQFVSPYSLEECRTRLERRTQPTETGLWKGATRLRVRIWVVDAETAQFVVNELPRGDRQLQIPNPAIRVCGTLYRQADGTTAVEMHARNNPYLLIAWNLAFFAVLFIILGFPAMFSVPPLFFVVWALAVAVVFVLPSYRTFNTTYAPLVSLVEKALKR